VYTYLMPQPRPLSSPTTSFLLLGLLLACPLAAQEPPVAAPPQTGVQEIVKAPEEPASVPAAGDVLYAPVAVTPGGQSLGEKFDDYAVATVGPRAIFSPALSAAIRMARPRHEKQYPRDWRLGAGAFGRNYGSALATGAASRTARFLAAAALHEDFRYRPSTSSNPLVRSFHAIAFTFVDKSDSGHNRIAVANFLAAGAGGFVGNLYLPAGFNNVSHAETRTATRFGGMAVNNLLREFGPDISRVTRRIHIPFPRIPIPAWW